MRKMKNFKTSKDAYQAIDQLLTDRNLSLMISNNRIPQNEKNDIKLKIKNEDFRIFLARFAEAIGPNVVWNISGYDIGRHISFSEIQKDKN